jgi:[calcium/calmodulin-dependent protein kinase] kinase
MGLKADKAYSSAPAYHSPLRHHKRQASHHKQVKETLNAKSEYTNNEDDGHGEHRINQYIIKEEIGRGSFGAVHLAVDQYGKEYVRKTFHRQFRGLAQS